MSNLPFSMFDITELIGEIPPDSIVSRTFYKDDQIRAIAFGFAPGQELSEHTASMPAVIHILSGEGTLTFGEEVKSAKPGVWAWMPANLSHSVVADTDLRMLLLLLPKE